MIKKSAVLPDGEALLYERVRDLVVTARQTVARGVDLVQVRTNFEIGRHIVEFEQQGEARASYGKAVLKALAEQLTLEFGSGFSETNLKLMRQFYLLNGDRIGQTVSDFSVPMAIRQTLPDESKSPCPKMPTSTPANTSSTCQARKSCSKSCRNGPGTWKMLIYQAMTGRRNDS